MKKLPAGVQRIMQKIVEDHCPEKIILFGSYAWGTPTKDSDLDFFIIKKTGDTRKTARMIDGSLFPREYPMDILVYTPKRVRERLAMGDSFIKQVVTSGTVLYERKK